MSNILRLIKSAARHPDTIIPYFVVRRFKDAATQRMSWWNYGGAPRVPIHELFPEIGAADVEMVRPFDRVHDVSVDTGEALVLAALVRHLQPRRILDLGTFDGNTALNLARNAPADARVYTVDLPREFAGSFRLETGGVHFVAPADTIGEQFAKADAALVEKIVQLRIDSADLAAEHLQLPLDFAFIDAGHSHAYVHNDSRKALSYLRTGGHIVWHDYGALKDVSRAVDELADELTIRVISGTRLAIAQKP